MKVKSQQFPEKECLSRRSFSLFTNGAMNRFNQAISAAFNKFKVLIKFRNASASKQFLIISHPSLSGQKTQQRNPNFHTHRRFSNVPFHRSKKKSRTDEPTISNNGHHSD
jgi:hypothetical protein